MKKGIPPKIFDQEYRQFVPIKHLAQIHLIGLMTRFFLRCTLASSAGACARRFLVTDAARLVPAPHLRDENLIEGAGASILEQRNGRGTAGHHC